MSRSKYINTFNTTAEYDSYIESAYPEFPNVCYDKQAGEVKIMRTSPNDHIIIAQGANLEQPTFTFNGNVDIVSNLDVDYFYVDNLDLINNNVNSITSLNTFSSTSSKPNNINIEKLILNFNTELVTSSSSMFYFCSNLKKLYLNNIDLSSSTNTGNIFRECSSLTDVYINVEATLMKLTNNLSSLGNNYVPSSATIHYDNGSDIIDYKWQNNAWTPQS